MVKAHNVRIVNCVAIWGWKKWILVLMAFDGKSRIKKGKKGVQIRIRAVTIDNN